MHYLLIKNDIECQRPYQSVEFILDIHIEYIKIEKPQA